MKDKYIEKMKIHIKVYFESYRRYQKDYKEERFKFSLKLKNEYREKIRNFIKSIRIYQSL